MRPDIPEGRQPRDYARPLRSTLTSVAVLALLGAAAYWCWHQPFMAKPRLLWELSRMPPPPAVAMPVDGVASRRVADTFGAPRGTDRSHDGVDIFAARGRRRGSRPVRGCPAVIDAVPGRR
ncbi:MULTISPECIES: hypothetical protein [unclassified Luteimonas]